MIYINPIEILFSKDKVDCVFELTLLPGSTQHATSLCLRANFELYFLFVLFSINLTIY